MIARPPGLGSPSAVARPRPALTPALRIVLGALSAFGPLSIDMYLPSLPALARNLDAAPAAAQLTLTACLVGLAAGQIVAGPASDALGRRRPLLVGLAAYAVASLLCAAAPSVWALAALRLVQGAAGAVGIVVARAVVRDRSEGTAAARTYAALMAVSGLAPVLAPLLGGQLVRLGSWRVVFLALTAVGALILAASARVVPETLPPERRRRPGGVRATFAAPLGDRRFVAYAAAAALGTAALFAYISGSPFALEDVYGLSPQGFSAAFAANALGILAVSQVGGRLVGRVGPRRLFAVGLAAMASGGLALVAAVAAHAGLWLVLPSLFCAVASMGLLTPNATALALAGQAASAGAASALLGVGQYVLGALLAPLAGAAGAASALPMAAVIAALALAAVAVERLALRGDPR